MTNRPQTATRRIWMDRIQRFENSGQSVAQFCDAEAVSNTSLYQWRRKLRDVAVDKLALAKFVPVQLPARPQAETATVMSVELPGGVRVRFEVTAPAPLQACLAYLQTPRSTCAPRPSTSEKGLFVDFSG